MSPPTIGFMNIEIVNTGSELMLGRVLNSHQQWLCRRLSDLGYSVSRQIAVSDSGTTIAAAVQDALTRADLVLVTGGLGPTSDDLTRTYVADLLHRPLKQDPSVLATLEEFYRARQRPLFESVKVQALVPQGGTVLPNQHGTAPGLVLEDTTNPFRPGSEGYTLIMLPGPPRELYPMFDQQVAPLIQKKYPLTEPYRCLTLKTTGLGESMIEEAVGSMLNPLLHDGLIIGYCARVGEVEVRLEARGKEAASLVSQGEQIVRQALQTHIFGIENESLEAVVIRELVQRKQTVALAESCTGGLVAHRLTNVPGASAAVMAGLVTYSNEAKQRLLGVPADILATQGAVSEATARAMAEGARLRNGVDYAIAITGIAGPSGGTPDKPVGTVFIGLASAQGTRVQRQLNRLDRESFKQATAQQALDLLRRALLEPPTPASRIS